MANLLPNPKMQFFDLNGDPLAGGKVNAYEAGTSTRKATYTTADASVANANPVILDARGEANIWWSTGAYKIVVTDSSDSEIYSIDNVVLPATGPNGSSFLTGSGVPDSSLGQDGDSYLNITSGDIYFKSSGAWSVTGTLNIGTSYTQQAIANDTTAVITSLLFDSASTIEFYAKVVSLRGTSRQVNLLRALFTGTAWDMSESQVGDCGMSFSINSSTGQISYTSSDTSTGKLQWSVLDKTGIES